MVSVGSSLGVFVVSLMLKGEIAQAKIDLMDRISQETERHEERFTPRETTRNLEQRIERLERVKYAPN